MHSIEDFWNPDLPFHLRCTSIELGDTIESALDFEGAGFGPSPLQIHDQLSGGLSSGWFGDDYSTTSLIEF